MLAHDEQTKRPFWKIGEVIKLNKDFDGEVRTATVKMSHQKQIERSINHLYSLEVSKKESKKEEKTKPVVKTTVTRNEKASERQDFRPLPKSMVSHLALVVCRLLISLTLVTGQVSTKCNLKDNLTYVTFQNFVSSSIFVMRNRLDNYCWHMLECRNRHVRESICVERCECEDWTSGCIGDREPNDTETETVKELAWITLPSEIYNVQLSPECSDVQKVRQYYQIELLCGRELLAEALHLWHTQELEQRAECIGKGPVTGTSAYCKDNGCQKNGTKLCFYHNKEKVYHVENETG